MSDSTSIGSEDVEVVGGTGMTNAELEAWSQMTSEEQLEFFEKNARVSTGSEPVSWEAALATSEEATPDIVVQKRKQALVGVPFIVRNIKINPGQWGLFVTFTAVTQTPIIQGSESNSVIINDSSKGGLAGQIAQIAQKHGLLNDGESGVLIKGGLKESIYYVDNDTKKVVGKVPVANSFQASTFYLNL